MQSRPGRLREQAEHVLGHVLGATRAARALALGAAHSSQDSARRGWPLRDTDSSGTDKTSTNTNHCPLAWHFCGPTLC